MRQLSFARPDHGNKKKRPKREMVLEEMNEGVPRALPVALIELFHRKAGNGRQSCGLEGMRRIHFLRQWSRPCDPGAGEVFYDIEVMRAFAGLVLGRDAIPDETTILNFRHLLERHEPTKALFEAVRRHLEDPSGRPIWKTRAGCCAAA